MVRERRSDGTVIAVFLRRACWYTIAVWKAWRAWKEQSLACKCGDGLGCLTLVSMSF